MGTGKKKIEIKMKEKEQDRMVAFSKRRKGLFKKAHQLHALSGAKIALLVFSPAGKPYIYGEPCFTDIVDEYYHGATKDKDCQEIEGFKSWLERMDLEGYNSVDDLLQVKNDLEQVRDWVLQSISHVRA